MSCWRTTRPRPDSGISFVGSTIQWLLVSLKGYPVTCWPGEAMQVSLRANYGMEKGTNLRY